MKEEKSRERFRKSWYIQAAQSASSSQAPKKASSAADEEDLDPNKYYERRVQGIKSARESNIEPYPHKFHTSIEIPAFISKYNDLPNGEHNEGITESIAGEFLLSYKHLLSFVSIWFGPLVDKQPHASHLLPYSSCKSEFFVSRRALSEKRLCSCQKILLRLLRRSSVQA